jgi:hypothetical protein
MQEKSDENSTELSFSMIGLNVVMKETWRMQEHFLSLDIRGVI